MEDRRKLTQRHVDGMLAIKEITDGPKTDKKVHCITLEQLRHDGYVEKSRIELTSKGFMYLIDNGHVRNNVIALNSKKRGEK